LALRDIAPMFPVCRNLDHKHVRTWDYGGLLVPVSDGGFAFSWTLNSLPNSSEFTSLYDTYRIDMVECIWELTPVFTMGATTKTSSIMPVIMAWPDYDNATAPASLAVADQIAQVERLQLSEARPSVRRSIRPKLQLGVAGGPVNQGANQSSQFLDMTYDGIVHYGVKFWIKNFNTTTVVETGAGVSLSFRFHMTMRNPR